MDEMDDRDKALAEMSMILGATLLALTEDESEKMQHFVMHALLLVVGKDTAKLFDFLIEKGAVLYAAASVTMQHCDRPTRCESAATTLEEQKGEH